MNFVFITVYIVTNGMNVNTLISILSRSSTQFYANVSSPEKLYNHFDGLFGLGFGKNAKKRNLESRTDS